MSISPLRDLGQPIIWGELLERISKHMHAWWGPKTLACRDPSTAMSAWELSRQGQEDDALRQRESSLSQTLVRQLDTGFVAWHEPHRISRR
jgi:hypothetical protein